VTGLVRRSGTAIRCSHAPDGVADVVGDEECTAFVEGNPDGSAIGIAVRT
jgi:hypothetical protein